MSCRRRSSRPGPGRWLRPARMRCSCRDCRSGNCTWSRACPVSAGKRLRICCGAWGSEPSVISPHCRAGTWPSFRSRCRGGPPCCPGEPARRPDGRELPPDLDAVLRCDPPIDRVDAAAFAGRTLAGALHRNLETVGVGCTRLAIHAVTAGGGEHSRVWRCAEPLTGRRHRRPGALATRRLVDLPAGRSAATGGSAPARDGPHRSGDDAATATRGGRYRGGAAVTTVGWPRRRRSDAGQSGAGTGTGSAGSRAVQVPVLSGAECPPSG